MTLSKNLINYEIIDVNLKDIIIPENLIRQNTDFSELQELKFSIIDLGLLHPITLLNSSKGLVLKAGWRRFQVFRDLKEKTIPACIITADESVGNKIMLDENLIRKDINIVDQAYWLALLMKNQKINQKTLAKKVHRSEHFISDRLKILDMDDFIIDALKQDLFPLKTALILAKGIEYNDRLRIYRQVIEWGAPPDTVQNWVNSANLEQKQKNGEFSENEYIDPEQSEYIPSQTFCDFCEQKTSIMVSKFVRVCPTCWEIGKKNMGPD